MWAERCGPRRAPRARTVRPPLSLYHKTSTTRRNPTDRHTTRHRPRNHQHAPPEQPTRRPPDNTQTHQPTNTNQPRHRPPTHPHGSTSPSNRRQRGLTRQRASRSRGEHPLRRVRLEVGCEGEEIRHPDRKLRPPWPPLLVPQPIGPKPVELLARDPCPGVSSHHRVIFGIYHTTL